MERIAVGVGDAASRGAVDWVIHRARRHPVEVALVRSYDMVMADPIDNRRVVESERNRILGAVPGTTVTTSVVMKTVLDALVDAAADADLVVVGARRDRPVRAAVHGSVPLRIASRARCATVIVPMDWRPGTSDEIVAGLDDGDTSGEALLFAAREAVAVHAPLTIVHTWWTPPQPTTDVPPAPEEADVREQHSRLLADAVERVQDAVPAATVRGALEERLTADALADRAEGAGLVVIGSHRWGPLTGLIFGSTARALLARTSCAICIVPPPEPARGDLDVDADTALTVGR